MSDPKSNCPFTGQPCQYHKSLHVTDIVEGHCVETHFCGKCSDKVAANLEVIQTATKKIPVVPQPPVPAHKPPQTQTNLFFEFLSFMLDPKSRNRPKNRPEKRCPSCGYSMDDIRRLQRLGCPQCHDVFQQELHATMVKAHSGGTHHVGKVPKNLAAGSLQNQLARLDEKLKEAVQKEDYEAAAVIRDAINEVKKQVAGG